MRESSASRTMWLVLAAMILFLACGIVGGAGFAPDVSVIRTFVSWRAGHAGAASGVIALTQLGGAGVLVPVAVGGIVTAGFLRRQLVWPLALTLIGGRLTVELIKVVVARPRPSFDAHPVTVFSQSFPSAHAANSMLTFLALALWLSPPARRVQAVVAAVTASLAIGVSRPVLGVHWPTDVVGGWSFAVAWVLTFWTLSTRFGRGSPRAEG